ncbi:hypothetical protein KBD08_00210 [Candidatus Babeliales bacterium]|nr:hypothetical protein [Candidatus Babeliales bacterium]
MNRIGIAFLSILIGMSMYGYGSMHNSSSALSSNASKPSDEIFCNQIMKGVIQAWMASIDYLNLVPLSDDVVSEMFETQSSGESLLECRRSQEEIDGINRLLSSGVHRMTDSTTTKTWSGIPQNSEVESQMVGTTTRLLSKEDL